ncbi:MAG: UDP-N-acetylmuramoyl-L-alanyl-D-glutamate--2,6-diaminopimelate ligase [Firmicutes bacterium HGW-Firmicutes-15]|nr:MAG: UDP-N-acetylmuramoyl-L-alanyl-D-glutamate--2,6-diaminopimelate ligase [Firmicutes bacterium HGW-Firmicutes-15]
MQLKEVMQGIDYRLLSGQLNQDISGISYDSRKVKEGDLFICIAGLKVDGHDFVEQAIHRGAKALLVEKEVLSHPAITILHTTQCRMAMAIVASNFFCQPSHEIKTIGVTGTNGKTTSTHLIKAILEEQGNGVGIMGTLYARMGDNQRILGNTTPESLDIEEFISLVREEKGNYLVMEVSSHALNMSRVDKIKFHAAVFTNLTQDHLDYHLTMDNYKESKLKLFKKLSEPDGQFAIINADDPASQDFMQASGNNYYSYGINNEADVRAINLKNRLKGTEFTVVYRDGSFNIGMKLIGLFNVYNALASIAFALKEGIEPAVIKTALENVSGVAGRFEQVDCGQDFTVIVDYAHTPDGLENILKTGREILENRMITVFGCGGDRDRKKRPLMGRIAAQYSDFCIVTSDNPRSEEPEAILDDIIPGLKEIENSHYAKIVDRREAIHQAICLAKKGDLVIIAGKGHETYQLVKDQVLEFDDRKVALEFLRGKALQ